MASTADASVRAAENDANCAAAVDNSTKRGSHLLVAGCNAHHQLFGRDGDVRIFTNKIDSPAGSSTTVLFSGWSTTVLATGQVFSMGNQDYPPSCSAPLTFPGVQLRSSFGDHNGIVGCLDDQGRLYLVNEPQASDTHMPLVLKSEESSPLIGAIALAQNDRIALSFKQAPNGRLCHVVEFENVQSFKQWFEDPSAEQNYPPSHHMLPGRPKQLVANHGTFVLLMDGGEVYSWGDARYQTLARPVTGEGSTPADKPGAVEALGGLHIDKIASGGWLGAALSRDGALYIWGNTTPGSTEPLHALESASESGVALVELPSGDGEAPDVLDMAVGDNHIAVIAEDHQVYVTGDNRHGQLGLASAQSWLPSWEARKPRS
ncbi:hypothetical protein CLAFUW4_01920 [Fulvia fulva]|uniref:Uncharacterized protein n=1 Tax=Passalora fulva TaxID=5499 RepID=A0A9Q8P475_PASFU|nr:uncharacterized protein CLAFUR5_01914 [Fulvia fulva]KAK4635040.1 hypothetical protein CLAFUR4_01915 [Fulvia fulva]KAK4636544.1 hypothetical protein CLAFUR0_01917 [Fulvia fulva]UJO12452.1 hypothetical protein CLAFUR5_01914 [Fulvia fulva]WPV08384.1 hypothetical protein CLAFUW4_01920 [Fulvia fulva]WPV23808.1 hypothetical protein CLAFUW7_01919 [Fulvia fulva]